MWSTVYSTYSVRLSWHTWSKKCAKKKTIRSSSPCCTVLSSQMCKKMVLRRYRIKVIKCWVRHWGRIMMRRCPIVRVNMMIMRMIANLVVNQLSPLAIVRIQSCWGCCLIRVMCQTTNNVYNYSSKNLNYLNLTLYHLKTILLSPKNTYYMTIYDLTTNTYIYFKILIFNI